MFKPHGIITPVLTALDKDENFSEENYKKFIDHLIRSGVHGIFSLGTNGEFYAFSFEEKIKSSRLPKKLWTDVFLSMQAQAA